MSRGKLMLGKLAAMGMIAGSPAIFGDSANLGNVIEVSNPGMTTYVVDGLTPDIWYFASTAMNSQGMESNFSSQVTRDTR